MIGLLNTSYTVSENDGAANIQIGVIQGSLERSVVVQFSTNAISAAGKLMHATMIIFKEASLLIQMVVTTVVLAE